MNRFAPVMVARMTTSIVAGRTPGTVTWRNAANFEAPSDGSGLVELLRDVLQGSEVEQDEEAELLPGHEHRDHRHRQRLLTSHDGSGPAGRGPG